MNTNCMSSKMIYTSVKKKYKRNYRDFSRVLIIFLNLSYDIEYTY